MKTTMNAELSNDEEVRVLRAWDALRAACAPDSSYTIPDMLGFATSVVMAAHELRRAIADACHYAERRAFEQPTHSSFGVNDL